MNSEQINALEPLTPSKMRVLIENTFQPELYAYCNRLFVEKIVEFSPMVIKFHNNWLEQKIIKKLAVVSNVSEHVATQLFRNMGGLQAFMYKYSHYGWDVTFHDRNSLLENDSITMRELE